MTSLRLSVSLAVVASALAVAAIASAQQQPGALAFLQGKHQAVERILRRPAKNADAVTRRNAEVTRMLGDLLDYDALSQAALGPAWAQHTPAERTEFTTLLRQLVEHNYQDNLNRTIDFTVRYDGEEPAAGGATLVRTTARSRTNRRAPAVEIAYTMRRSGNVWKVTDVTTDGVSLVRNYRQQFTRIIQRDGWPALITRMRSRLNGAGGL